MKTVFKKAGITHTLINSIEIDETKNAVIYELTYPANPDKVVGYHIGYWQMSNFGTLGFSAETFRFVKSAYKLKGAEEIFMKLISKNNTK